MTEHCYCEIDVAKDRLDVRVLPHRQRFSVDNNATGWDKVVERLRALPIAAVAIEPAAATSAALSELCSPLACRSDASILVNFVNSPGPAASSPRTIASMRS